MELLRLCQSIANGVNSLSFFVTGGGVAEIVRTIGYIEFRGALIALEKVKRNPNSRTYVEEARACFRFAYESFSSTTPYKKIFRIFFYSTIKCQKYKKACEAAIFVALFCKYLGERNDVGIYTLYALEAFDRYELHCVKKVLAVMTIPARQVIVSHGAFLPKKLLEDKLDSIKRQKETLQELCKRLNL